MILKKDNCNKTLVLSMIIFVILNVVDALMLLTSDLYGLEQCVDCIFSGVKVVIVLVLYISCRYYFGRKAQSILRPLRIILSIDIIYGVLIPLIGNVDNDFKGVVIWAFVLLSIRYFCVYFLFVNLYKKISVSYYLFGGMQRRNLYKLDKLKSIYFLSTLFVYFTCMLLAIKPLIGCIILLIFELLRLGIEFIYISNFLNTFKLQGPLKHIEYADYKDADVALSKKPVLGYAFYAVLLLFFVTLICCRFNYSSKEEVIQSINGYEVYAVSNKMPLWTGFQDKKYGIRNDRGYDSGLLYERSLVFDKSGIAWYKDRFIDLDGNTKIQLDNDVYAKKLSKRVTIFETYYIDSYSWIFQDKELNLRLRNKSYFCGGFFQETYFVNGYARFYSALKGGGGYVDDTGKTILYPKYTNIDFIRLDNSSENCDNPYKYMSNVYVEDKFHRGYIVDLGTGEIIISGLKRHDFDILNLGHSARGGRDSYNLIKINYYDDRHIEYYDLYGKKLEIDFKDAVVKNRFGDMVHIKIDEDRTISGPDKGYNDNSGNSFAYSFRISCSYDPKEVFLLYDKEGNILVNEELYNIDYEILNDGTSYFSAITVDNKPAIIDKNGNVTKYNYYVTDLFRDDEDTIIFEVRESPDKDAETFYIDMFGNKINPKLDKM